MKIKTTSNTLVLKGNINDICNYLKDANKLYTFVKDMINDFNSISKNNPN